MEAVTIKTNMAHPGQTRPMYFSSSKTVQQVVVETYIIYRRFFNEGRLTHREYFSVIRCLKR
jgi:hypothetical protein